MRSVRSSPRVATLAAIALVMACTDSSTAQTAAQTAGPPTAVPPAAAKAPSAAREPIARALPDFAPLVEAVGPAVVNVEVTQQRQNAAASGDPFFDEFRRRFGIPDQGDQGGGPVRGAGSGFIVSPDGYILTNTHVVDQADEVTVRLTDRREFTAKVIGSDRRSDVAVIKIDAKNLPFVRFGDPSKLKPGQWVLAIGAPFGFEASATAGIVSATSRSLPQEGSNYVPFIQSDVAVNPGNSGGPLFNLDGEVVGINSQIFSRTGGYMGVSFAIPIDVADNVREQLVKTGRVTRGRIGVVIQEVNAQFAQSFGLDRPRGALVARVEEGGPGARAGLKPGDVILDVNGQRIERSGDLPTLVGKMRPGTDAKLNVWRDRKARPVTVRVDELDEPREQRTALRGGSRGDRAEGQEAPQLGLAVRPLQAEEREQFETKGNLLITQVSGPAAAADLRRDDIVLGVNGRPVKTVEELREAATKSGKNVSLLIQRGDAQIFVPLRIG